MQFKSLHLRKRKLFLFFLLLSVVGLTKSMAQSRSLLLEESFDGASLPVGWSIDSQTSNWSVSSSNHAGGEANEMRLTWNPQFNGVSRLISPSVNLTGLSSVIFSFKHALDNYSGSSTIGVATSSDGGITWNQAWSQVYSTTSSWLVSQEISTIDMGQANVQFCIFFDGSSYNINDWYFDDIKLSSLENLDLGLESVIVPDIISSSNIVVGMNVFNYGITSITSVMATYTVEGMMPVTEIFSVNISYLNMETLTFSVPIFLSPGNYIISFSIDLVNGEQDDVTNNNFLEKTIRVAVGTVDRIPMIEHFSSSTCPPCASLNTQMLTFCNNNLGRFTYTKYPMNWPGYGDPYYTNECGIRRTLYDVNAVPQLFLDGENQYASVLQQTIFDQHANQYVAIDIKGSFYISGNTIHVKTDIMPYVDINARLFVSVNEKETHNNVGSNGESSFHHICMKLLPEAQGLSVNFNACELHHFEFTYDMTETHVEEMSDLEVAIWVQDDIIFNSYYAYEYTSVHPYPVQNLSLVENNDGTLVASWSAPSQATGYRITVNGEVVIENTTSLSYSFPNGSLSNGTIGVQALYGEDKKSVIVFGATSINPETTSYLIRALPNLEGGGIVTGEGVYNFNDTCTLTATPSEGYSFSHWAKNGESFSDNPVISFTVTEADDYVAYFTLDSHEIVVTANPEEGGTVLGGGEYDYGSTCTLTARSNQGFTFMYWTENGQPISSDTTYSFTVTNNRSFVAHFALPFIITATANLTYGGTITGAGEYDYGTTCTLTATAYEGYTFMYWTENGQPISSDTTYSFTVTNNRVLVAHFTLPFSITVTANPEEGGVVLGAGEHDYQSICTLTAVANEGYTFMYWTENGQTISSDTTYSFAVTNNRVLVAHFKSLFSITVTANPADGGVVSGSGAFDEGEICTLIATPNEGYSFCSWTENDSVVAYRPTYSFTVTGDRNLVANFGNCLDVVIGYGGTSTNTYLPSYSYYKYSLTQQIYTAEEIGKNGSITSVAFYNGGATKTRDYEIYMVNTDKTSFVSVTDWITVTADDLVFSGSVTMEADTWTTIVFDAPFTYDGISNLALIVDDNTGSWTSSPHMACRVFDSNDNQAIRIYSDNTNYDPNNPTQYNGTRYMVKNQIILGFLDENQRFISVSSNPHDAGTINGGGAYYLGDTCTLTAVANGFYGFVNWTKDSIIVSNSPIISFTVTENTTYVANYTALINHDENNIVYVKPNGCGLNDGSSWDNATSNLNLALEYSGSQIVKPVIWVAAGTYYGDSISEHNAFTMVDGVNVYGGFAGNEPADFDLSQRDFVTNATILDGQNVQRVLYQPAAFENNTTWSGFTIKNGYLYVENTSIISYGAGAYIRNNFILESSVITANSLYVVDNVSQGRGAGVYIIGANSQLTNCIVSDNNLVRIDGGGPLYYGSYGGGVYANLASVNNCVIANNHTNSWAGGMLVTAANVSNCLIVNNNAKYSGGIHAFGESTTNASIINCDIINNNAIEMGGGVGTAPSTPIEFTNCIIWGNNTDTYSYLNLNVGTATSFNYCAIEGGYAGTANINLASDNDGTGNLNYVRFIDPTNNNYQLQENSVCIDAGDPNYLPSDTLDIAGNPRVYNNRIDIGCYEYNNMVIETNLSDEICQGEDYLQNGFEIFQPEVGENEYSITLPSLQGLDSIVNLTLTVFPTYYYMEDTTLCNATSYEWRGHTYTQSGIYYDSLQTIHGCDSIYALSLEFFNTTLGEFAGMTPTNNYPFTSLPITFSWDAVSGAEYYNLYLWNVNEPVPSTPYAGNIYNRSCYVPSLQNHQTYNWYVEAVNTCFSTTSSVRSFSLNIPPSMNVSASSLNFGEVALNNSNTLNLYVSGNALNDTLTMQILGEDASMFSYVQSSNWNGLTGGSLSVTFSPTAVQYTYTANLVITTGTLTQTVQLSGSLADMFVFNTYVTQDVFEMNSTVPIYGTVMDANNNPAASAEVEVKVTVMNMTRSLFATTGSDGHFSVDFVPAYSESGYYTINSGRVGHNSTAVHDDFNIPGMNLVANGWILWDVVQNETSAGSIVIRNRSQIPLTNIQVTATTLPEGCSFTFQPLSLQGMEEGVLEYSVTGSALTSGNNYEEVRLVATSDEGATMSFSAWYYCAEPRGILFALPNAINTTMTKGISKIVDVMLYNNGTGPTGSISIDLPSEEWLSVVGNDTLSSIAVHDSAYFSMRLSANANTPLVQYTGNIALNCERGDGLSLPFSITAVSDSTGTLVVDVTDDYTYNGNGQHLAGAMVTVKGYYSLATVAIGLTNSDGLFTVEDIPEGYYRMSITAPHHAEYQAIIQIEGGQTNVQDIYLQYQAITYSWNVVPTEIQDEYTFELIVEYETNVPVPVVVIDMPQTFPELEEGQNFVFDYVITNYGLVDTYNATLYPPTGHPLYEFTPLITEIDTLHAQSTIIIPCTMTRRVTQRSQRVMDALGDKGNREDDCPDIACTDMVAYYYCNGEKIPYTYQCCRNIGSHPCNTPPSNGGGGGGPGGGGYGGGGGGFGSSGGGTTPVTTQQQGCDDDPCLSGVKDDIDNCPNNGGGTPPNLPPQNPANNR